MGLLVISWNHSQGSCPTRHSDDGTSIWESTCPGSCADSEEVRGAAALPGRCMSSKVCVHVVVVGAGPQTSETSCSGPAVLENLGSRG